VRIIGICPIKELFEADNVTSKGPSPLFWIYFPEVRPILAKAEVFNRFNDAERRTYDDIFFKRMFTSYIYKESNVYDRWINEYAKGMDGLLESERIKNDIFVWEHDLWEY
jgi:gliding motility associated protien GldN